MTNLHYSPHSGGQSAARMVKPSVSEADGQGSQGERQTVLQ